MKTWVIPLSCIGLLAVTAQAQDAPSAPPTPTVRQACQADVQKFCGDVKPGGGRIRDCMAEHKDDLSQACRDALSSARAHHQGPKGNGAQDATGKPQ
jgi:Cysteine rich repeat